MSLLQKYVRALLLEAGADQRTSPKVIFMAGGPASGKSTVIKKLGLANEMTVVNPDDAYEAALKSAGLPLDRTQIVIDYREIKKKYMTAKESGDARTVKSLEPEYLRLRSIMSQNMKLFSQARNQAKELKADLAKSLSNILVDGTGGNYHEILKQVDEMYGLNYNIGMIYLDVPLEVSLDRNLGRAARGGRSVDEADIVRSWNAVNKNLEKYRQLFSSNFFYIDASEKGFDRSIRQVRPRISKFLAS